MTKKRQRHIERDSHLAATPDDAIEKGTEQ